MAKSYTVTQRVYSYDAFEEEDIPAGMTAEQYAEARYTEGCGDLDSHDLMSHDLMLIIEEPGKADIIIDPVPSDDEDDTPLDMTGRCGKVGKWTDDDGDEVNAVCIVVDGTHIRNLHASADLFWTDDLCVPTCDECSESLTDDEDIVNCPDGKVRCITCVEAMYRENGGES